MCEDKSKTVNISMDSKETNEQTTIKSEESTSNDKSNQLINEKVMIKNEKSTTNDKSSLLTNEQATTKVEKSIYNDKNNQLINEKSPLKSSSIETTSQKKDSSPKKRKSDFKDSYRSRKKLSKDDFEIRFLISSKHAGALIGKKGSNITFLRQNFNCSVVITDCPGPERVLSFTISSSQVEQILASIIGYLEESNQNSVIELRLLLHTNCIGSIIGKNGTKLKDIRQNNSTSIKIFSQCCPRSSERICIIQGQPQNVITCVRNILDIVYSNKQTGKVVYYNPINYVANDALNYGGFLPENSSNSSIKRGGRDRISNNINNSSRRRGSGNRRGRLNQKNSFDYQSEVWNRNSSTFYPNNNTNMNNWPQVSNQMNTAYQLQNQSQLTTSLDNNYPTSNYQANNYQANAYQPQQQNSYYMDSNSTYPTSTNNQMYNHNSTVDMSNQFNQLNTPQINTFWSSFYNAKDNMNMPINQADGRANISVLTMPK